MNADFSAHLILKISETVFINESTEKPQAKAQSFKEAQRKSVRKRCQSAKSVAFSAEPTLFATAPFSKTATNVLTSTKSLSNVPPEPQIYLARLFSFQKMGPRLSASFRLLKATTEKR